MFIISTVFSINHKVLEVIEKLSIRHFFFAPKTYAVIDRYENISWIYVLFSVFSVSETYFELAKVRIFKVLQFSEKEMHFFHFVNDIL